MDISTARMVLGVDPEATNADVKEAFREQIKEEHPDQSDSANADERSKRLIEARDVLLSASTGTGKSRSSRSQQQQSRQSNTSTDSARGDSDTRSESQSGSTDTDTTNHSRSTDSVWEDSDTQSRNSSSQQTTSSTTSHDPNRSGSRTQSGDSSAHSTAGRSSATTGTGEAGTDTSHSYQSHRVQQSSHPLQLLLDELLELPEDKLGGLVFSFINVVSIALAVISGTYGSVFPFSEFWFNGCIFLAWIISSGFIGVSIDIREGWSEGILFLMWPLAAMWFLVDVGPQLTGISGTFIILGVALFPAIVGVGAAIWHIGRGGLGNKDSSTKI